MSEMLARASGDSPRRARKQGGYNRRLTNTEESYVWPTAIDEAENAW